MAEADLDRNLLFGVIALQMDFVSRAALLAAIRTWVLERQKPLDQILVEQGALTEDERGLLEPLVGKHLEKHGDEVVAALARELDAAGEGRNDLRNELAMTRMSLGNALEDQGRLD